MPGPARLTVPTSRCSGPAPGRLSMEPSSKSAEATRRATVRDGDRAPGRRRVGSRAARAPGRLEEELRLVEQHRVNLLLMGQATSCSRWSTRCRPAFISRWERGHPANGWCFHPPSARERWCSTTSAPRAPGSNPAARVAGHGLRADAGRQHHPRRCCREVQSGKFIDTLYYRLNTVLVDATS